MSRSQPGILAELPARSRYIEFSARPGRAMQQLVNALSDVELGDQAVVGFGAPAVLALGASIEALVPFPAPTSAGKGTSAFNPS